MESLKQFHFKYLVACSLICAIASISYFKFEETSHSTSKECINAVVIPQKLDEKRLKYWAPENGEIVEDKSLRSMNRVFKRLNYEFVNGSNDNDWDVLWSIDHVFYFDEPSKQLKKPLKPYQKVTHFPGNVDLVGKSRMTTRNKDLKYVKPAFRKESLDDLILYARENPGKKFLQKSKFSRGIQIVNVSKIDVNLPDTFYQEFLDNPFLVENRVIDLGVFVLITSVNPLRVYRFNEEVLLRFGAVDYHPFDASNINKYVIDDTHTSPYEMKHFGSAYRKYKCTFKSLFEDYIEKRGFDVQKMWRDVDDAIASIVLNSEESIIEELNYFSVSSKNFFELVRFDILFDDEALNPYVMEVNMSPNLSPTSPRFEDNALIYEQIIYNAVKIIGGATHHEFMSRHNNDTTIVNMKNIAIRSKQCIRNDCVNNCQEYACRLCLPCLNEEHIFHLKEAYREHTHTGNFHRVFPTARHFKDEHLRESLTKNNKISIDWYREKCKRDARWC